MKYRPNLWSTVDRIQCSPDDRKRTIYIPEVHTKKDTTNASRDAWELKNAYRL